MGYKSWRTPTGEGKIFTLLDEEFLFTMDAAASHANALLPVYCTETGKWQKLNGRRKAQLVALTSGLDMSSWGSEKVFCNPPYDESLGIWLAIAQEAMRLNLTPLSVLLLPPSTDTAWFHNLFPSEGVYNYVDDDFYTGFKTLDEKFEFRHWKGRVKFLVPKTRTPDGEPDETDPKSVVGEAPRAGNLVVIYRA